MAKVQQMLHLAVDRALLRKLEKAINRSGRTDLLLNLSTYLKKSMKSGLSKSEIEEIEALIASLE